MPLWGGDELALILPDTAGNEAIPLAERVRTAVEERFQENPEEWGEGLTLSIGIACYPDDAQDKKTLIEKADLAMYYAKRTTKNAVKVFDPTDFANLGPAQPHLRNDRISSLRNLVGSLETDGFFQRHSETVAFYAAKLALEMGLDITEVDQIVVASLLHDIGVIVLPNDVLTKEGKLTPDEMEKVKHHPVLAVNLLDSLSDVKDVLPIILHHHEKFDGQGYPEKLAGLQIPLGARILAVADAYNAMQSERPFRLALSKEEAIAELRRCSGTQFDPEVVEAFLNYVESEEEGKKEGRKTGSKRAEAEDDRWFRLTPWQERLSKLPWPSRVHWPPP